MVKLITGINDLATLRPDLAAQWHPTKNGDLKPTDVTCGSKKKVWWTCSKGHDWEATITNRSRGNGCPICDGKQTLIGYNDLATLRPDLALQWHPTKNGDLTPETVTKGFKKKIWWICSLGHEWQSTIANRLRGDGCPFCSGHQILVGYNDLATTHPELAKQWHPTKNGNKTPEMFSKGSGEKAWWICSLGHEWEARIADRSQGNGCPICAGQKVLIGYNDLATTNPELAKQWHPTKNGDKTPEMFSKGSNKKAWWICLKGHEWCATIYSRVAGSGCPICNSESQTSFPEQAIYYYLKQIDNTVENRKKINNKWEVDVWIPSKNIAIEYDGIYYHAGKKSNLRESCKNDYLKKHNIRLIRIKETKNAVTEFFIKNNILVFSVINNYCQLNAVISYLLLVMFDGDKIVVDISSDQYKILELYKQSCLYNSLVTTHPELVKQWHPTKNGTLTPQMFSKGSHQQVWWICPLGHSWKATINSRAQGCGCPICSGHKVLKGFNDLATTHPKLASEWHPTKNGNKTPEMFSKGSEETAWWVCPLGHEWQATIGGRSHGSGCPICLGHRVVKGFNDLATTNPKLASEWHPTKNGNKTPEMFSRGSHQKAWWICPCGHEWCATIYSRVDGNGCPLCAGKHTVKNT